MSEQTPQSPAPVAGDGWMPWSGDENPVPGQMVEVRYEDGTEDAAEPSETVPWRSTLPRIIAFRLSRPASEQPVEASGAGREEIEGVVARLTKDLNTRNLYREDDGFFVLKVREDDLRAIIAALPPASPARPPMGGPQVLKGVGKINGDGWKDTTSIGEVVYVWNAEKPSPYAPGQYPRIDNEGWSASTAQYDFSPASVDEVRALAAPTPMGGDREHSSRCWGRTSFSDEVLHCYCQTAPTPMGGEVEALYDEQQFPDAEIRSAANLTMMLRRGGLEAEVINSLLERVQALAASSPSPAQGGRPSDEQIRRAIQTRLHLHPTDETLGCLDRAVADIQALFAPPSVQPGEGK